MNNRHLNIVAGILAGLAVFGLFKGQVEIFVGFLFLSGMIFGAGRMASLEEDENAVKSIAKKNLQLAGLGILFGGISFIPVVPVSILASFGFGVCFGLIGVNMIFEKKQN